MIASVSSFEPSLTTTISRVSYSSASSARMLSTIVSASLCAGATIETNGGAASLATSARLRGLRRRWYRQRKRPATPAIANCDRL